MANVPARDARGRLLPGGGSLNPGGRRALDEKVRQAIHDTGVEAMARLSEIIADPSAFGPRGWLPTRDQLKAIEVAADRAFGRPAPASFNDDKGETEDPQSAHLAALASAVAALEAEQERPGPLPTTGPPLVPVHSIRGR
ncbi:MAG: hypothetical protein AAGI03_14310, partial [Pseudomonadota bacterium]